MIADAWSGLILLVLVVYLLVAFFCLLMLRRPTSYRPVVLAFLVFQADLIGWTAAYLLSYTSVSPNEKQLWFVLVFAVANFSGFAWLVLALACTDRMRWLTKRNLALLAIPGAAMATVILTNDGHHLFFSSIAQAHAVGDLDFSPGPLYWVGAAHCYVYIAIGSYLHGRFAMASSGRFRWLGLMAVASTIPPLVANVLAVFRFLGVSFGMTQVAALASSLAFVLVIAAFNFRLGNTVRLAINQAVAQMGDAIIITDPSDRVLGINSAFEGIFDVRETQLLGRHIGEVVGGLKDRIGNLGQLLAAISASQADPSRHVYVDVVLKGTPERVYDLRLWPIRRPDGTLAGRVATMRDVTEVRVASQKLAEMAAQLQEAHSALEKRVEERTAELATSERRFRLLAENIREVFWIATDFGNEIPYASPMYEEVWGRTRESLYQDPKHWVEAIHPEDRQRVVDNMALQMGGYGRTESDQEYRIVRPDGEIRWVRARVFPFRDEEGEISGVTGIAEDVSEQRGARLERERLGEAIERERTTLSALMASMSDGLVLLDSTNRVRLCNARAAELLGTDVTSATGQSVAELFTGATVTKGNRVAGAAGLEQLLSGQGSRSTFDITTGGLPHRELSVDLFRVVEPHGSNPGIGMLLHDVTGSRLLALFKERERIAMDLHDGVIQSLYAVGLGLAAQERMLDKGANRTRESMRQARTQLSGVIQEIRNYIFDLRLQKLGDQGLRAGLEALAEDLRVNALINPELELDPGVEPLLDTDTIANMLHIVREATSNVIRHAGANRVTISVTRNNGTLTMTIRDNGRGFDARELRPQGNGSGNGLGNMCERARAVGGRLETVSEPGNGTEVRLELPLREATGAPRLPEAAAELPEAEKAQLQEVLS